jgi:hypothetical protein
MPAQDQDIEYDWSGSPRHLNWEPPSPQKDWERMEKELGDELQELSTQLQSFNAEGWEAHVRWLLKQKQAGLNALSTAQPQHVAALQAQMAAYERMAYFPTFAQQRTEQIMAQLESIRKSKEEWEARGRS